MPDIKALIAKVNTELNSKFTCLTCKDEGSPVTKDPDTGEMKLTKVCPNCGKVKLELKEIDYSELFDYGVSTAVASTGWDKVVAAGALSAETAERLFSMLNSLRSNKFEQRCLCFTSVMGTGKYIYAVEIMRIALSLSRLCTPVLELDDLCVLMRGEAYKLSDVYPVLAKHQSIHRTAEVALIRIPFEPTSEHVSVLARYLDDCRKNRRSVFIFSRVPLAKIFGMSSELTGYTSYVKEITLKGGEQTK